MDKKYKALYGRFTAKGVIEDIRMVREGKTSTSNADYKCLSMRIKTADKHILNLELFGQTRDNLPIVKFTGKEKEEKTVKWADRFNIPEGFGIVSYMSVGVSNEVITTPLSKTRVPYITSYDAIGELISNFKVGDSIAVSGTPNWSSYVSKQTGELRTNVKFNINKISKIENINFEDENFKELCHFVQPVVIEDTELNEDKTALILDCIIITKDDGTFVRTNMEVSTEKKNFAKALHNKKLVPSYSVATLMGDLINEVVEEVVEEDDDDTWGSDPNEERKSIRYSGLKFNVLKLDGGEEGIETDLYTEDDFISSINDELEDKETVNTKDAIFDTEDDDMASDDNWLDEFAE